MRVLLKCLVPSTRTILLSQTSLRRRLHLWGHDSDLELVVLHCHESTRHTPFSWNFRVEAYHPRLGELLAVDDMDVRSLRNTAAVDNLIGGCAMNADGVKAAVAKSGPPDLVHCGTATIMSDTASKEAIPWQC
jgi:hypothetical protein